MPVHTDEPEAYIPVTPTRHAFELPGGLPDGRGFVLPYAGRGGPEAARIIGGLYVRLSMNAGPPRRNWCSRQALRTVYPSGGLVVPDELTGQARYGYDDGEYLSVQPLAMLGHCFADAAHTSGQVEQVVRSDDNDLFRAGLRQSPTRRAELRKYARSRPDRFVVGPTPDPLIAGRTELQYRTGQRAGLVTIDDAAGRLHEAIAAQFLAKGRPVAAVPFRDSPRPERLLPACPSGPNRGQLTRHPTVGDVARRFADEAGPKLLVVRAGEPPGSFLLRQAVADSGLLIVIVAGYLDGRTRDYDQFLQQSPDLFDRAGLSIFRHGDMYVARANETADHAFVPVNERGQHLEAGTIRRVALPHGP